MLRGPFWSTTTISPGSTSRTKEAPRVSRAQVSELKSQLSPSLPMQRGRKPLGSRAAMSFWGDMITRE